MGKPGKSQELLTLRNKKLIRRYYELTEVQRMRFDDALELLSREEFFISPKSILQIIRSHASELTDLAVKPVKRVRVPQLMATN